MDKVINTVPGPGQTRLCVDPWSRAFVRVDGQVCLCCYAPPVGSIKDEPLLEILTGLKADAYRNGLLEGRLPPACVNCPEKKAVDLQVEQEAVRSYLETGLHQWY